MLNVDHEQSVRQTTHVLDTAQRALQLLQLTAAHQRFFLGQLFKSTIFTLGFQITQTTYRLTDSLVVGQHTAQPAVINERHAATQSLLANVLAGSALGANEHNLVLAFSQLLDEIQSIIECRQRVLKVDDVNLVTSTKDVLTHLWVPVTGLVAKVYTSLQHIAHGNVSHDLTPKGLCLHTPHNPTLYARFAEREHGAPRNMCRCMCVFNKSFCAGRILRALQRGFIPY